MSSWAFADDDAPIRFSFFNHVRCPYFQLIISFILYVKKLRTAPFLRKLELQWISVAFIRMIVNVAESTLSMSVRS